MTTPQSTKKHMTPKKLQGLLIACLLLLFAGGVALFWFTYRDLQTYGTEVAAKNGEAVASNDSLSTLQATKVFLDNNTALIDQVRNFTLQRELPQFQIRNDILHYANLRGVDVTGVELDAGGETTDAGTGGTGATSTAPTTPTPTTPTANSNQLSVTVKFGEEVDYMAFLKFLHDIEHNLPKMTVEKVSIAKGNGNDTIKVEPIIVKTYITQ